MKIDSVTVKGMLGGVAEALEEHESEGAELSIELVAHSLPHLFLQSVPFDQRDPATYAMQRELIVQQLVAGVERLNRQGFPQELH